MLYLTCCFSSVPSLTLTDDDYEKLMLAEASFNNTNNMMNQPPPPQPFNMNQGLLPTPPMMNPLMNPPPIHGPNNGMMGPPPNGQMNSSPMPGTTLVVQMTGGWRPT